MRARMLLDLPLTTHTTLSKELLARNKWYLDNNNVKNTVMKYEEYSP